MESWKRTQENEKEAWLHVDRAINGRQGWESFLRSKFSLDFELFNEKMVLEVGCGMFGISHSLHEIDATMIVGTDSLTLGLDDHKFHGVQSMGECLPFKDNSFEVVVCFNVLDHCLAPLQVLKEINRVAVHGGILILWVHTLTTIFERFKRLMRTYDKFHLYHFGILDLLSLLRSGGFQIKSMSNSPAGYVEKKRFSIRESFGLIGYTHSPVANIKKAMFSLIQTDTCIICVKSESQQQISKSVKESHAPILQPLVAHIES
jgi:ubiquinone/menaquinone biosynthesis C-methylase UbiE